MTPVLDGAGKALVLDRHTSVGLVGNTAYVVSVTGDVYRIDDPDVWRSPACGIANNTGDELLKL